MFANELTHSSPPTVQEHPAQPAANARLSELPALLRQSLVMWERIFARQEILCDRRLHAASTEPAAVDADPT